MGSVVCSLWCWGSCSEVQTDVLGVQATSKGGGDKEGKHNSMLK